MKTLLNLLDKALDWETLAISMMLYGAVITSALVSFVWTDMQGQHYEQAYNWCRRNLDTEASQTTKHMRREYYYRRHYEELLSHSAERELAGEAAE